MHVTAKADYAVRAVVELAGSSKQDSPRKVDEVAQAQGIPVSFLENILTQLRSSGIVRSQRGPEGGYWLAQPPRSGQPRAGHPRGRGSAGGRARAAPGGDRIRRLGRVPAAGVDRAARQPAQSARARDRRRRRRRQAAQGACSRSRAKRKPGRRARPRTRAGRAGARRGSAPRASSSSCALARVTWAQISRPSGSVSSTRTSKPRCTTRLHERLGRAAVGASGRIWMSCGRRKASPRRLTGPMNDITNSLLRALVQLARRARLLDPPGVHHDDLLGDLHRLLLVVRDEDRRHVDLVVQPAQPFAQLAAHLRVQRAERLVQQQHFRLDRQRARERHPLQLAARELRGVALGQAVQPHEPQQLLHARVDLRLRPLSHAQPERDVVVHRHVLERRVVLEDEAHAAVARRRVRDLLAADRHARPRRAPPGRR